MSRVKKIAKNPIRTYRDIWYRYLKVLGKTKCAQCGYDDCFAAIDFHHIYPKDKKFEVGRLLSGPVTKDAMDEIEKCLPLCANCHRKLHDDMRWTS